MHYATVIYGSAPSWVATQGATAPCYPGGIGCFALRHDTRPLRHTGPLGLISRVYGRHFRVTRWTQDLVKGQDLVALTPDQILAFCQNPLCYINLRRCAELGSGLRALEL